MSRLRSFGIHRSSLDSYRYQRPHRKWYTRQIVGRPRNLPYQWGTICWQIQWDGEGSHSRAKTRPPDFRSLFCMIPSRHKSQQSHPCASERWSSLRRQLSCHTKLEMVLLHQGKPSTHRWFWNHFDDSQDSSWGSLQWESMNIKLSTVLQWL